MLRKTGLARTPGTTKEETEPERIHPALESDLEVADYGDLITQEVLKWWTKKPTRPQS